MKKTLFLLLSLAAAAGARAQSNTEQVRREVKAKGEEIRRAASDNPMYYVGQRDHEQDMADYYRIISNLKLDRFRIDLKEGRTGNGNLPAFSGAESGVRTDKAPASGRTPGNPGIGGAPSTKVNYRQLNANRQRALERARELDRRRTQQALEQADRHGELLDLAAAAGLAKIGRNAAASKPSSLDEQLAKQGYLSGPNLFSELGTADSLPRRDPFAGLKPNEPAESGVRTLHELIRLFEANPEDDFTEEEIGRLVAHYNEEERKYREMMAEKEKQMRDELANDLKTAFKEDMETE